MGLFGKKSKSKKDKHLAKGTQAQSIGHDTANEVFKVQYDKKHAMGGETSGFFKPDGDMAPAKYGVAASRLAKGMGWDSLIPETQHATHNVMDNGVMTEKKGAVSKAVQNSVPLNTVVKEPVQGFRQVVGDEVSDVDLKGSNTQKQLNQLQWFDALIGNSDRHGGNVMVNPGTGDVSGIDNDLSFGHDDAIYAKGNKAAEKAFTDGWGGRDEKYLGLPGQLDESTAAQLLKLNPKKLKKMLNPKGTKKEEKLNKEELQASYDRLAKIQEAVGDKKKSGSLVKQWDDTTYDAAVNETKTDSGAYRNYIQRQHQNVLAAKDTKNDIAWTPGNRQRDAPGSLPQPPVVQPPVVQPPVAQPVASTAAPAQDWKSPSGPQRQGSSSGGVKLGGSRAATPSPARRQARRPARLPAPTGVGASTPTGISGPQVNGLEHRVKGAPWEKDLMTRPKR